MGNSKAIQGAAGCGKTAMMKEVRRLCEDTTHEIVGITQTTGAKRQLKQELTVPQQAGVETLTVAKFLNTVKQGQGLFGQNTLFVVDESSLVGVSDMVTLQKVVKQIDARMLIVGDFKQHTPITQSFPMQILLASGINHRVMNEIVRIKNEEALEVVQSLYQDKARDALEKLKNNIVEIEKIKGMDKEEMGQVLIEAVSKKYLALHQSHKGDVALIGGSSGSMHRCTTSIGRIIEHKNLIL
jgi:ATP-dependent exoDNAse (exonuclease V) alpha subunit